MYNDIKIEKLDHFGRGIAYINKKVVFIKNALKDEVVDIKIINEKKKYMEAVVINYKTKSSKRIYPPCPFYLSCGGCSLECLEYNDTLDFKLNKIKELITRNKIEYDKKIDVIKNVKPYNYRNKISLKIVNESIGFYEEHTHNLININNCMLASNCINIVIKNYKLLNIKNGTLTVRSNQNDEILLIINSDSKDYNIELAKLKEKVKLVGIVYNNKTIYGNNFYYERINGFLFKVSYDSFFQVNPYVTKLLFEIVVENLEYDSTVLDLYCGVGTLSIALSTKALNVYGVEIVPNAVINAIKNAKLNNKTNVKFMLGNVSEIVNNLNIQFDTLILDPPRSGIDKNTINFIIKMRPCKIIYISCDSNTLMRDLKELQTIYKIEEYKILDMFSYTYHVENICILKLK